MSEWLLQSIHAPFLALQWLKVFSTVKKTKKEIQGSKGFTEMVHCYLRLGGLFPHKIQDMNFKKSPNIHKTINSTDRIPHPRFLLNFLLLLLIFVCCS